MILKYDEFVSEKFDYTKQRQKGVLLTSPKGAKLITDGIKCVWVMGRSVRDDGTFTKGALDALNNSDMTYEDGMELVKKKQERLNNNEQIVVIKLDDDATYKITTSGKAYGVTSTNMIPYKRSKIHKIHDTIYLPASLCNFYEKNDGVYLELPKWLYDKNKDIKGTLISNIDNI